MKEIPLTRGKVALVDDVDYERLSKFSWHATANGYAARREGRSIHLMHRDVLLPPLGFYVDHKDGNKLNNLRSNLRVATMAENLRNRGRQDNNTSGFKGVSPEGSRWRARIKVDGGRYKHLGYFDTPGEAADAYKKAAQEYHGEFARTEKTT